jgi:uncharacterized protein (TIGR03084 family)
MAIADTIVDDLRAESEALDVLVGSLPAERWASATPAAGWTIAHQIAHLLWTDRVALASITDEARFSEILAAADADRLGFVDAAADELATAAPADLLADWRDTRTQLHAALRSVPDGRKLRWFGPPMSAASMATARLMETWAHGLDVSDALGVRAEPSARLKQIAHIGVRTRDFAFTIHGRTPPAEPFRVELQAPDGGQHWMSCCTDPSESAWSGANENTPPPNVYSPTELADSQWRDAGGEAAECTHDAGLVGQPDCQKAPGYVASIRSESPAVEPLVVWRARASGGGEPLGETADCGAPPGIERFVANVGGCDMVKRSVRKQPVRCRLCGTENQPGKTMRFCKVCAAYACCGCWTGHTRAGGSFECAGAAPPAPEPRPPLLAITGLVGAATIPLDVPVQRDLAEACMATPAPPTLLYVPRQTETRVAAILVRVAHAVVRAHAEAGPDSQETCDAWRLLWLAPYTAAAHP